MTHSLDSGGILGHWVHEMWLRIQFGQVDDGISHVGQDMSVQLIDVVMPDQPLMCGDLVEDEAVTMITFAGIHTRPLSWF